MVEMNGELERNVAVEMIFAVMMLNFGSITADIMVDPGG